jgi:radical SAM protein with 4Fe4S-binding SPASM domain
LTEKRTKKLLDVGLDEIKISFDGENPQQNDLQRVHANFSRDAQNVKSFLAACINGGYKTKVILSNIRLLDKKMFMREKALGQEINRLKTSPQYLSDFFAEFIDNIEIRSYQAMAWPGISHDSPEYTVESVAQNGVPGCSVVHETITIRCDGSVVPCCYDLLGKAVQGNILDDNIFSIWDSGEYVRFRKDVSSDSPPPRICQDCLVFSSKLCFARHSA